MLYSIRSERLLMEEIDYSNPVPLVLGMNLDDQVWDPTTFTKNRERLLDADVARAFLSGVVHEAKVRAGLRMSISPWMARCWKLGRA